MQKIILPDEDAEIPPVPTTGGGHRPEPQLDRLSNILKVFNDHFGDIPWEDADRVRQLITETIPARVAEDAAYKNAKQNSDKQNARIEHDQALARVMTSVLKDDTELFKQFMGNESFKRWMTDTVFGLTYDEAGAEQPVAPTSPLSRETTARPLRGHHRRQAHRGGIRAGHGPARQRADPATGGGWHRGLSPARGRIS